MRLPAEDAVANLPGLYIACGDGRGAAIFGAKEMTQFGLQRLDSQRGPVEITVDDTMVREWPFGESVRFRLLLKEFVLEFYLDDLYVQSYSLPDVATGWFLVSRLLGHPSNGHTHASLARCESVPSA